MIVVHVFGGFALEVAGSPRGTSVPRRLAAILAVLAVHGDRGIARDRLLHLLWSDADPERSRHALTQSLYALRRLLGVDDAISGTAHLSFNPERVSTDVADLERALAARDATAALEAYHGTLLDGFSVPGAPEFERWVDEQRALTAQRLSAFLDAAAKALQADGDPAQAVMVLRRRAALDPLDATAALSLMRAWALAGDTPAAVQHARVYGELVRQELDLEPDPRVEALAREIQDAARAVPPAPGSPRAGLQAPDPRPPQVAQRAQAWLMGANRRAIAAVKSGQEWWRRRSRRWRLIARQGATVSLALVAVLLAVARFGRTRREIAPPPLARAVVPFRATGIDSDLAFLPVGIVDLLTESLAERDSIPMVDAETVHRWWQGTFGTRVGAPSDSVLRAAGALRARQLVTGSLVGSARQVVLRASLLDLETRRVLGTAAVNGTLDSLPQLVDRAATMLVASAAGAAEELSAVASADPRALRAYLEGRAAYQRADYRAAQSLFGAALARDSTIGSAAVGLALASDWLEDGAMRGSALEVARRMRERLPMVEQQQLNALQGPRFPQPSSGEEQFAAWERAARTGEHAGPWVELGRRLLIDGRLAGLPDADERARAAFTRAIELDSAHVTARLSLAALATARNRPAAADRREVEGSPIERSLWDAWRDAAQARDARALERVRERFDAASDDALRRIALAALGDAEQLDDGVRALRARAGRPQTTMGRVDAILAEHAYALNEGSPSRALAATRRLEDLVTNGAHLRLRVLDGLYSDGDTAAAAAAAQRLAERVTRTPAGSDEERSTALADLCVLEQWRVWHGDFGNVEVSVRALSQAASAFSGAPVVAGSASCALVLDGIAAGLRDAPGAGEALARAERLALAGPSAGDLRQYATLALARVRERRGELQRALALVDRRSVARGWPRYLTSYLRLEASLAERLEDTARATAALRQYVALRASPDSAGRADADSARAMLRRLGGTS